MLLFELAIIAVGFMISVLILIRDTYLGVMYSFKKIEKIIV